MVALVVAVAIAVVAGLGLTRVRAALAYCLARWARVADFLD
jgi:hypothetical protein